MKAEMFVISMSMDVFRMSMGMKPSNFTKREVTAWFNAMSQVLDEKAAP